MKSVYLLSNFNENDSFKKKIIDNIDKDLIEKESLLFIASSPTGYAKTDHYFNINKGWLELGGVKFCN